MFRSLVVVVPSTVRSLAMFRLPAIEASPVTCRVVMVASPPTLMSVAVKVLFIVKVFRIVLLELMLDRVGL